MLASSVSDVVLPPTAEDVRPALSVKTPGKLPKQGTDSVTMLLGSAVVVISAHVTAPPRASTVRILPGSLWMLTATKNCLDTSMRLLLGVIL